jgi:hypothetical protein
MNEAVAVERFERPAQLRENMLKCFFQGMTSSGKRFAVHPILFE